MAGLDALEADPATKVIAVLSKPPGERTQAGLMKRLSSCTKPVVVCLLGAEGAPLAAFRHASTIDGAVCMSLEAANEQQPGFLRVDERGMQDRAANEARAMHPGQRHVRGLFAGGTLCYQAQSIFRRSELSVYSNAPLPGMRELIDPALSKDSTFLDMGAEMFVRGRPHPMIDATQRRMRLEQEARDPSVAVILLDFILGAVASEDPVGDLAPALVEIQKAARARGSHLCIVASVCGTEEDRQSLPRQTRALEEAGVLTFPSSAQAAQFCAEAARQLARRKELV
jgi:hypothetical protein